MTIEYLKDVLGKVEGNIKTLADELGHSAEVIKGEQLITNDELFHLLSELMLSQQINLRSQTVLLAAEIERRQVISRTSN